MADPPEPFWRTRYYALEVMTKPGRRARSSVNDANGMVAIEATGWKRQ
jgi:hypothetical protein